jgi:hypothetical protein
MHPRSLTARVSRLISYLYIPSGRELVSMIKKAAGVRRKFRAEYLTLSESELCLGSGRLRAGLAGRLDGGGMDGAEDRGEEIAKPHRAMLYTGIQPGIVPRVYANLKDPPSRPASRGGGNTQSENFSAGGWRSAAARDFITSL